jgi:signal transduction histidine kinase
MSIKFISYLIIYLIGRKRNIKDNTFIILIAIIQAFFISLECFLLYKNSNILTIIELLISIIIFYSLPIILLYLFNLGDNISSLYLTVSKYEKEKQLKNSLFKITHEVKNPIAVCKGYLDMLNINDQDKVSRYIPIIKQEIDRSLNIMTDFMEFSKIKIEKEILDINILLEDIIDELNIIINNKNIKMTTRITQDEIFITGDYNRLKQVFINIIKNSIESISKYGTIDITTHILKDQYYIEITDNGCGMDEYTLSKINDLFFTTKKKGSGLGVSLSNEIIKAHKGSLDYTSKPNKGTKVIVKLPITMI